MQTMRIKLDFPLPWRILILIQLFSISSSIDDSYRDYVDMKQLVFEYARFSDIEKQCSQFLSSGYKVELSDSKIQRIVNELSFYNGDWVQENNGLAPLMPFDATDMPAETSSSPLKLVNFEVKDVRLLEEMQNSVGVGGVLSIGMTRSKSFDADLRTKFSMNSGISVLTVVFEGVYVETDENRLLCLVGNTALPSRRWLLDWQNEYWSPVNRCPNPMPDDQIVLILRFPKVSNLLKRSIEGEMRSEHEKSSFEYFDKVLISSQLGWFSNYQFSSTPKSGSCNAFTSQELMEDGANNLNGSEFCRLFQELSNEVFKLLPDRYMNDSGTDRGKLGPFVLGNEVLYIDKSYRNVKLIIQNVKCNEESYHVKTSDAKVSVVFRVIPAETDLLTASTRTGLSGMTLSAEGMWDSSTGQLCMIGLDSEGLEAQVSMYFPRSLSIKQRSIVVGRISSGSESKNPFSPLHFSINQRPFHLDYRYGWYISYLSYNYSKIKEASEFRERGKSFDLTRVPERFVLRYPAIQEKGGFFSLSEVYDLPDELNTDVTLAGGQLDGAQISLQLEVLSIGPFLARYDFLYKVRHEGILEDAKMMFSDDGLINVSLLLSITENPRSSGRKRTLIYNFLEGQYGSRSGTMYLIGCGRGVTGPLDCLTEVKVQYPPKNLRWLRDSVIKVSVRSQRNADDPLYFRPIELQSNAIPYDMFKREDYKRGVRFRMIFEGILQTVVVAVEIVILWSQMVYMDQNTGTAVYISMNMLACQILSYSLLLITGGEILVLGKANTSYENPADDLMKHQAISEGLHYARKLLAAVALVFNIRLFHNVSESRKRLNDQESSKIQMPLGDRHFILWFLRKLVTVTLIFCGITVMASHDDTGSIRVLLLRQVTGLGRTLHDLSLVAQIFENWLWKKQAKCLRKAYYIGLPSLTMVLKIYNSIRAPTSHRGPANISLLGLMLSDFDTMSLIVPVLIVHIQQNFNYLRIINCLNVSRFLSLQKLNQLLRHH